MVELGASRVRCISPAKVFTVLALDFSATALQQLRDDAQALGINERVSTTVHDVRTPLTLGDASTDAVFAHMLLCMALSTQQIHAVVDDVRRILRPRGVFVYTVRHTGDAHYGAGISHGDNVSEHGGFAVCSFTRDLASALADGWTLGEIHAFEEGELPRRLWRITQTPTA